ncbi:MAG: AAA family ATPase [Candidatus Pacebacteria bacterium]|nr:AAA family ATPase [Candidatus Paceibacterota bacterium]
MIIKKFVAKNVHKNLNFNITFNNDVNFILGTNGTGKTTVLKLMESMLVPSIRTLLEIDFEEIIIECLLPSNLKISAMKTKNTFILSVSKTKTKLKIPLRPFSYHLHPEEAAHISRKYSEHPVIKKISKLPAPLFLGVDRRIKYETEEEEETRNVRTYVGSARFHRVRSREVRSVGVLHHSLSEISRMIVNYTRVLKVQQEEFSKNFKSNVMKASFHYIKEEQTFFEKKVTNISTRELESIKKQFLQATATMESDVAQVLNTGINSFFNKMKSSLKKWITLRSKMPGIQFTKKDFEIFKQASINLPQLSRIWLILEEMQGYQKNIKKLYASLDAFKEAVNLFFKDSQKVLEISPEGELKVYQKGKTLRLQALSSGEKQILIMLAHLMFNRKQKGIFLIDEPELSLHLSWQEIFVKALLKVDKNVQFILATHTPTIIAGMQNKVKNLN